MPSGIEEEFKNPQILFAETKNITDSNFLYLEQFGDAQFTTIDHKGFLQLWDARLFKRRKRDVGDIIPAVHIDLNLMQDQFNNTAMEEEKEVEEVILVF